MASAILSSRNDPRSSDFMSKFSSNSNLNFSRLRNVPNPNPNPNLNPNSSQFFIGNARRDFLWKNQEQLPPCAPPGAAFNRSSINSVPANSYGYRFITFRLCSYTRRELKQLKKRLISDLERVRALRHRVCSAQTPKLNYHPPQLGFPTAPEAAFTGKERQKSAIGQKRVKPLPAARDTKKQCGRVKNNAQRNKVMMRKCGQILTKLMKHKHGWVFNVPVDAAAMKLYDYHNIINNPMDLGTIKLKLSKNEYESPLAFASDVRLTFHNAMVYNGRGSDVFAMAERLLLLFEDMFNSTDQKFSVNEAKQQILSDIVPISVEKPIPIAAAVLEPPVAPQAKAAASSGPPMVRVANKPEMTPEEKSELAERFKNLQFGHEGMEQIMAIVKKGSLGLERQGDEIELDLAVLDNETLWELHSFIGRIHNNAFATDNTRVSSLHADYSPGGEPLVEEHGSKRDAGEEDIDIGEEMQLTNFPWLEIEKDAVNVSSSGSSSSSSDSDSSSSDSGSGSSSGNSCNEQEANSTPKCGGSMGL